MTIRRLLAPAALAAALAAPAAAEPLVVGSTPSGVPFTFLDVSSNEIQGMMVDLIRAVGEEAGFEPEVRATDWSALIPSLTSGRIDVISAAMLITETRDEVIDFSDPVFPYGEALVVAADDDTAYGRDFSEFGPGELGVQQGTIYLERMEGMGVTDLAVYDSLQNMMRDVELGRIRGGVGDRPILAYQLSQGAFEDLKLAESYESQFDGPIGIGVQEGNDELRKRINAALATLREDGTIDALAEKWNVK